MLESSVRGMRSQYTHPPNGSTIGTPSSSTSARLGPLAPNPRSDTPCVVGFATRLLERRKSEKPGTCRSRSSKVRAGFASKSGSESCTALRVADTTIPSPGAKPRNTNVSCHMLESADHGCSAGAKPLATTWTVPDGSVTTANTNSPSEPVFTVCVECCERNVTAAPGTTAPVESRTEPDTLTCCAAAEMQNVAISSATDRRTARLIHPGCNQWPREGMLMQPLALSRAARELRPPENPP